MEPQFHTPGNCRIAFFTPSLGLGGVGKMRLHLFQGFLARGYDIDLLVSERDSPYFASLPKGVRIFDIETTHTIFCLPSLVKYLRRNKPSVLVTDRIRLAVSSLRARSLSGVGTRIYSSVHRNLSTKFSGVNDKKARGKLEEMQKWYPRLDGVIAVSKGVGDDLKRCIGLTEEIVHVVYNPVVCPTIFEKARKMPDHPWFSTKDWPVVLAVGRLEVQKDYPTLLRAFSCLIKKKACRLIICGEGRDRAKLERMADCLGIREHVALVGFIDNAYAFIRQADVLVLSSAFEGFGNVLVEAMALGTPVVSTRCPSGPEEILQGGELGPLVPVGNAEALCEAILATIEHPVSTDRLKAAGLFYSLENSVKGYLAAMGHAEGFQA
jgi:glycosyltransferase involved in cell wall biosynthesis